MKIGLVSPYDYAIPGGVTNHISHLADCFARMGHQVKVLAPCSNDRPHASPNGVIPLGRVTHVPHNGSIAAVTLSWWLMPKVRATLANEGFDVVHVHEPVCPLLPWMVLSLSNAVNVGSFHAYYERSFWYSVGGYTLAKMLTSRLTGKIAVSAAARDCVNRYLPGDYGLIPNGIDLERFARNTRPLREFCDGKLNILFVGRLEERKGIIHLLQSYEQVKQEYPDTRLIIVGPDSGNGKYDYRQEVAKKGLEDVAFVGYVPEADLPRYYHTADIFCAPAIGKESFGIILLEAMAAGKPIIASKITGYSQLLNSGVEGLLVPPKDTPALGQAICTLLSDKAMREEMGARGKEKVKRYSWENVARETMDFYLGLLAKDRGRAQ